MGFRGSRGIDRGRYLEEAHNASPSMSTSGRGLQWVLDCPWCAEEAGTHGRNKLYVSDYSGHWTCYRCQNGWQCDKKLSCEGCVAFLYLLKKLEGTDSIAKVMERLFAFMDKPTTAIREKKIAPKRLMYVNEPLPKEYVPVWDGNAYKMPKYLLERGISRETAKKYKLGFCTEGKFFDRIILPLSCPRGTSFQARLARPEKYEDEVRYLSGPSSGYLLFGYEVACSYGIPLDTLVINEGPMDSMAINQLADLPAVATMGTKIREWQFEMIRGLRPKSIIVCYDPKEYSEELREALMLTSFCSDVRVMRLGKTTDKKKVDAASLAIDNPEALIDAILAANKVKQQRLVGLNERLTSLRSKK